MKCEKCKSEWNSSRSIQVCPFCGESLVQPESKKPEDILSYIIEEYGIEVFQKKKLLLSYFSDFAPHLNKEYKLLKNCCSTDFISVILSSNSSSNDLKEIAVKKALRLLMDECFMSEEYASNVIMWITAALKWEFPSAIAQPKIEQSNIEKAALSRFEHIESEPSSTTVTDTGKKEKFAHLKPGFCKETYEYQAEDVEYQLGMQAIAQENFKDALERFERAYNNGNKLAGTKLAQMYYYGNGCDVDYEKARSVFQYNADVENCPLATAWIAEMYRMGSGFIKDIVKAKEIYVSNLNNLVLMCEYGDSDAQYFFGFDLIYGIFGDKKPSEGFKWLEKSSNQGHIAAKVEVAKCYIYGDPVEKLVRVGYEMLSSISNTSNKKCHYELGKIYYYGNEIEKDYSKAFKHFLFAAERGHVSSQDYVGDMYYFGEGVSRDYVKAREWYEKAAEHNNSNSLLQLALIYDDGRGVEADKDKAFTYYLKAADLGEERARYGALYNYYFFNENHKDYQLGKEYLEMAANEEYAVAEKKLALLYLGRYDFEEDDEKFIYWLKRAALHKDVEAQRILGEAYYQFGNPSVLPVSYPAACEWLEKAAKEEDIQACLDLAELYYSGEGVQKNLAKAQEYLNKAETYIDKVKDFSYSNGKEISKLYYDIAQLYILLGDKKAAEKNYILAKDKGEIAAYCGLALIYVNKKQSYNKGFALLEEAYEKGSIEGTRLLGLCYKAGIGCKKSRSKAKALLKKAADKGDEEAKAELSKFRF